MSNPIEILLVEDNPSDAELTIRALKKNNLANDIKWVKDGAEALDFLFGKGKYLTRSTENQPKVILLDLKMPKVGGLEVLTEIRKDDDLKSIPVVILTSSNQEKDVVESYELGVNSYIVKPVEFEKFSQAIKEVGFYWLVVNEAP